MRNKGIRVMLAGVAGVVLVVLVAMYGELQYKHYQTLPYVDWLQDGHGKGALWVLVMLASPIVFLVGLVITVIERVRRRRG